MRKRHRSRYTYSMTTKRTDALLLALAVFVFSHTSALAGCPPNSSPSYETGNVVHCKCNAGYENRSGACQAIPEMRAAPEAEMRAKFRYSPHGLVGGTTWKFGIYAMNVPQNLSGDEARRARDESIRQFLARLRLAGIDERNFIDPRHYDFIIGVAESSSAFVDLVARVAWDNLAKGRATPLLQKEYDLLRGRSFDELDCHSNGAMICLAAIANGDVEMTGKGAVRLLGPQMTPAALREWERLAQKDHFALEIYYNSGDPVPRISYAADELVPIKHSALQRVASAPGVVKEVVAGAAIGELIGKIAPSAKIRTSDCSLGGAFRYSIDCHDFRWYQLHYLQ